MDSLFMYCFTFSFTENSVFSDAALPVVVATDDILIASARLANQPSCVISGSYSDFWLGVACQFSTQGGWILVCNSIVGK